MKRIRYIAHCAKKGHYGNATPWWPNMLTHIRLRRYRAAWRPQLLSLLNPGRS